MIHVNASVKNVIGPKKDCSCNPITCICENDKYLQSIFDTSAIVCYEIEYVVDVVSTNLQSWETYIRQTFFHVK